MTNQCIEVEMEYREWRECPLWYCLKTVLHNDGRIESEIMADEKTKVAIAIQSFDKPLDGVFETAEATTYYSYHAGYKEAARHLSAARV